MSPKAVFFHAKKPVVTAPPVHQEEVGTVLVEAAVLDGHSKALGLLGYGEGERTLGRRWPSPSGQARFMSNGLGKGWNPRCSLGRCEGG